MLTPTAACEAMFENEDWTSRGEETGVDEVNSLAIKALDEISISFSF